MKGLFLHGIYSMKRTIIYYAFLLAVYLIAGLFLFDNTVGLDSYVLFFLTIALVVNCFSYQSMSNWETYSSILPVSKKQLVGVYYMLAGTGIGIAGASTLFIAACKTVIPFLRKPGVSQWSEGIFLFYINLIVICILMAILIPLLVKFGMEKGRVVLFLLIFSIYGIYAYFVANDEVTIQSMAGMSKILRIVIPFLVIALCYASFRFSLFLYKKKEF